MKRLTLRDIYGQITEQREKLVHLLDNADMPVSPSQISDIGEKLSILNGMLGDWVPRLKMAQLTVERIAFTYARGGTPTLTEGEERYVTLESVLERTREVMADKKKVSDTGAKEISRLVSAREREHWERAETLHSDIWKLISMSQTHIGAERDERKGM